MRSSIMLPIASVAAIGSAQLGCAPELSEIREQFAETDSTPLARFRIDLYEQIREKQNARIARTSRIFCRAEYTCRWTEEGQRHFETGEGSFFFWPPDRVALCFGKLGETYVWMAHSVDRYWIIAKDVEKPDALLVKDGAIAPVRWRGNGMIIITPEELKFAVGMFTLPEADVSRWSLTTGVYRDAVMITLLDGDLERRVHFSEETLLPLRLEYWKASESRLVSDISLTHYAPLNTSAAQDETLMLPTRVVIRQLDPLYELEINVYPDTDHPSGSDKAFKNVFDFDTMLRSMGISADVVVKYGFDND